jgi:hypothetical protein
MKGSDMMHTWLLHLVAGAVGARRGPTTFVARNEMLVIDAEGGQDDLQALIDLFLQGCSYPSSLLVEPAFSYGRQVLKNRGRGRKDPRKAAIDTLNDQLNRGFAPEIDVLYPEAAAADLLDAEFWRLAETFMLPVLELVEIATVD